MTLPVQEREALLRQLLLRLFALLRLAEDRDAAGAALQQLADQLHEPLARLLQVDGSLLLQMRAGTAWVNVHRIPPDVGVLHAIDGLGKRLHDARIAGFMFEHGVEPATLIRLAVELGRGGEPGRLELAHVSIIELWDPFAAEPVPGERSRATHLKSVWVTRHLLSALIERDGLDLREQRRIVHAVVDGLLARADALALLTALDQREVPALAAAVREAVHAVALARELGLDEPRQLRIGACALTGDDEVAPAGLPVRLADLLAAAAICAAGGQPQSLAGAPVLLRDAAERAFTARPDRSA